MKQVNISTIPVFMAANKCRHKSLAKLLNIPQSNISYYSKNNYQVIWDNSGYCEIVKTARKFDLNELLTINKRGSKK